MGKIILGLLVGSLAFGQYSPPSSLPGSTYVWNGVPLTGVSTGSGAVTNVVSGNSATLHTAPAGKRSFVFVNFLNPTATTATYAVNKVNGTNACAIFAAATQVGNTNGNVTGASTVLEPGESLQVVVSVAGQMNFVADWIDFDSSVPLKSPTIYTGFASGDSTVYTVPANATALTFPRSGIAPSPSVANTAAIATGDASVTPTITIKIGGVQWAQFASFAPGTAVAFGLPGVLSAGIAIVVNSTVAGTTSCFIMPTLWERPS